MGVELRNESGVEVDHSSLQRVIAFGMSALRVHSDAEVAVILVDEAAMEELHIEWMGESGPTDVLSFAQQEDQPPSAMGAPTNAAQLILPPELLAQQALYLGDIIIAYPYTKKQAERNDRALRTELCLLAIHGTLHLLGFDHATPEEEAEMWAIQNRVLVMLGEEPVHP